MKTHLTYLPISCHWFLSIIDVFRKCRERPVVYQRLKVFPFSWISNFRKRCTSWWILCIFIKVQISFHNFIKIGLHRIPGSILKYLKETVCKYTRSTATDIYKHLWRTSYYFLFRWGTHLHISLFPSVCPSVHCGPCFRNCTSCDHYFWYTCVKWWYLQALILFFFKLSFFGSSGGWKGKKWPKMTKISVCRTLYFRNHI